MITWWSYGNETSFFLTLDSTFDESLSVGFTVNGILHSWQNGLMMPEVKIYPQLKLHLFLWQRIQVYTDRDHSDKIVTTTCTSYASWVQLLLLLLFFLSLLTVILDLINFLKNYWEWFIAVIQKCCQGITEKQNLSFQFEMNILSIFKGSLMETGISCKSRYSEFET